MFPARRSARPLTDIGHRFVEDRRALILAGAFAAMQPPQPSGVQLDDRSGVEFLEPATELLELGERQQRGVGHPNRGERAGDAAPRVGHRR